MNPTEIEALLARAFAPLAPVRRNGSTGRFSLAGAPGGAADIAITLDGGWAKLESPVGGVVATHAREVVNVQSAWPGTVKYVASRPLPTLRADVPLLADTATGRDWVVRQLAAAYAGLRLAAGQEVHPAAFARTQGEAAPHDPECLAAACAGAGFNASVKPNGTVRIDLSIRGVPRSIELRTQEGGVRAAVDLAPGAIARASAPGSTSRVSTLDPTTRASAPGPMSRASTPCALAAGAFLLRACAALRWARAFAMDENGALASAGFECLLAPAPDERALLVAVDTLITACEHFGSEFEVLLEHADIAARYLARVTDTESAPEDAFVPTSAAATPAPAASHAAYAALA